MVRDLKKILETLEVHEAAQERMKTIQLAENASLQDTLNALSSLTEQVQDLATNTSGSVEALNDKITIIKDFIIKLSEETTSLKLRIINIEDRLND
jgi:hypothetical protein